MLPQTKGKQLKIVISGVYHWSAYHGGNELYLHYLARELARLGHDVTYLTAMAEAGIESEYPIRTIPVSWLLGKPLPSLAWNRFLSDLQPDVFHASGSGLPIMLAGILPKRFVRVLTFQAPTNPPWYFKLPAWLELQLMRSFDQVITTTEYNQRYLKRMFPGLQIDFIPMMLSDQFIALAEKNSRARQFNSKQSDKVQLLFVGQLDQHHYYKGLPVLLQAMEQLPDKYHLWVVGDGDKREMYQQMAAELGLANRVKFWGFVNGDEKVNLYQKADVFVLPSTSSSEGFGLVLIEAMAAGTAAVTTTAVGSAEWLGREKVAWLCPPNQVAALVTAIKQAAEAKPSHLRQAAAFAARFSSQAMAEKTAARYFELLS